MIIGVILGVFIPKVSIIGLPGTLFVSALKAVAPLLVFVLVASALSKAKSGIASRFKTVIIFYLFSTFIAAIVAVLGSHLFPVGMHLTAASNVSAPSGLEEILTNILTTIFSNPIKSLTEGEYLGILFWSFVFGIALKIVASDNTKKI